MLFKDILDFMRIKICIYAIFLAMAGYLLFNQPQINALYVIFSAFFGCGAVYSYNNITDREEDEINRKKMDFFVSSRSGYVLIAVFFLISLFLAYYVSLVSFIFVSLGLFAGALYSFFRVKKRYVLVKNIYTALCVNHVFLLGASAGGIVTFEIFLYYLLFSFLIFISSIVSDMRDYAGDKTIGAKTLPILLGYDKSKHFVAYLLLVYSTLLLVFTSIIMLLPFAVLMLFSIKQNKPSIAHSLSGYSFVFLTFWLVMLRCC